MIIDAHVHLNDRNGGSAADAVRGLLLDFEAAGVEHGVLLHLLWQPWSVEDIARELSKTSSLTGFINIVPSSSGAFGQLERGVEMGFRGVKLHPRMQGYLPDSPECVALVRQAGKLGLPVLVDCFPDGDWLASGHNVLRYAQLAREAPETKLIVAHAAGHHCIDLVMLAKRTPNMWMDISYSWLYYARPVTQMLFYCLESMRFERVLFGTDHPYHNETVEKSVLRSCRLLDELGISEENRNKLLRLNAKSLLGLP